MRHTLAILLVLATWCHCEHIHDGRPLGRTPRRQLVEIVPVVRDGAPHSSAHPPSLAYIVPAPHLDPSADQFDDLSEIGKDQVPTEDLNMYADVERETEGDREADVRREVYERTEAELEREAEGDSLAEKEDWVAEREGTENNAIGGTARDVDETANMLVEGMTSEGARMICTGRGGRAHLHPGYTLSFVFGR